MRQILSIARTELRLMFFSPIAWIALIILIVQSALIIPDIFGGWISSTIAGYDLDPGMTGVVFRSTYFSQILRYIYLYIPIITMGIVSRELHSGSIKLLYSSPISNTQIIFGKFLSMIYFSLILLSIIIMFSIFSWWSIVEADYGTILTGWLGIFLVLCTYSAIGIFISSLTSYQIVAAIGTFSTLTLLSIIGNYWQQFAFVREVTYWLSINGRVGEFLSGMICSEDVLYFVIVSGMFLTLTIYRLNNIRQLTKFSVSWSKYLVIILITVLAGYVTSRPTLLFYYDATKTDENTLTKESQEIMANLEGPMTITTYVNGLDPDSRQFAIPEMEMRDMARFNRFIRFKPEIKFKYIRYFDTLPTPRFDWMHSPYMKEYISGGMEGLLARSCYIRGRQDPSIYRPGSEITEVDIASENMNLFRVIERGSGQKTFLRIFDDPAVFPHETEIASAMKRLYLKAPKIMFITGHEQRSVHMKGLRGINRITLDKEWRYNLQNQGCDVGEISLTQPVNEDIDIVVIADIKTPLTEVEMSNLKAYLDNGGNLILMNEDRRQEIMNPINNLFGVNALPGVVVKKTSDPYPDLTLSRPTKEGGAFSSYIRAMQRDPRYFVTMPSAVMLNTDGVANAGYSMITLLTSQPNMPVWNEVETTDFIDFVPEYNANAGEVMAKNIPTCMILTKEVNGKKHNVIILADTDWISNVEIESLRRRAGVKSGNYALLRSFIDNISNGDFPVNMSRPAMTDNELRITRPIADAARVVFKWVIPGILLTLSIFIWLRRRGR